MQDGSQKSIISTIIIVGFLIAGAILLRGSSAPTTKNETKNNGIPVTTATLAPVGKEDMTMGNPQAKVTLIMYEDFQCPFCAAITGLGLDAPAMKPVMDYLKKSDPTWTSFMPEVINNYVKNGKVLLVYRDFTFLGPESVKASEAARCAGDQEKFWEYHDYLYSHHDGENKGGFADAKLKSFAKELNLNSSEFDECLDSNKYTEAVANSNKEGSTAGVTGTPKGFILRDGGIIGTIDGAQPLSMVKIKIDEALK